MSTCRLLLPAWLVSLTFLLPELSSAQSPVRAAPAIAAAAVAASGDSERGVAEPGLRLALSSTSALRRDDPRWRDSLAQAYARRAWLPLWSTVAGANPGASDMLALLNTAARYGLDVRDYDIEPLTHQLLALSGSASATQRCQFDAALSLAAARFISDLHSGRVNPRSVGHDLDVPHASLDVGAAVAGVAGSSDRASVIADYEPAFRHYELLKQALARYRALSVDRSLTQLPPLPARSVKPGESYAGAVALRRLLRALGDMPAAPATAVAEAGPAASNATVAVANARAMPAEEMLDDALITALRSFQQRHGLKADGALGAGTFTALTTPLSQRVRQIELSLERSRWLPPQLNSPPILVNIPQFRLFAFYTTADSEKLLLQMNVIVGKVFPRNNTPVFAADMRFVVVRPYWDVPSSIVREEFLPKIRANAGWLSHNRFELVRGAGDDGSVLPATPENIAALAAGTLRLRQLPGDSNSLGIAKLMFPNSHNVYLHGTPAQGLFAEARRAFSHGCVRVEDPLALAAFVLRDQPQWTRETLADAAQLDRPTRIALSQPLRVFILYATAIATESGRVLFFEDIYGHDRRLNAQLAR
jgi:murein L,D-transpeptidase YcbB/YkuD